MVVSPRRAADDEKHPQRQQQDAAEPGRQPRISAPHYPSGHPQAEEEHVGNGEAGHAQQESGSKTGPGMSDGTWAEEKEYEAQIEEDGQHRGKEFPLEVDQRSVHRSHGPGGKTDARGKYPPADQVEQYDAERAQAELDQAAGEIISPEEPVENAQEGGIERRPCERPVSQAEGRGELFRLLEVGLCVHHGCIEEWAPSRHLVEVESAPEESE